MRKIVPAGSFVLASGLIVLFAMAVLLLVVLGQTAHASTITVDTTTDETNVDGNCSLREAITAANTDTAVDACPAGSGADTIVVPAGTYTLTIPGAGEDANATGDLDIAGDLTINGAGAGSTIIQACDSGGGPCTGIDRVFDIHGVFGSGTVTISGVTVRNGSTTDVGGGIFNRRGTLTIINSTVSGNSAGDGGGIDNTVTLTITNSTVSGNSAGGGGGIDNNFGSLTITNSTVSGNSASVGGGIENSTGGTLTLDNSTLSGNSAGTGGGILMTEATATLKNTIVANSPSGGNCGGGITSQGHNLSSDGSCAFASSGDLNNTDPMLGPLANNGGPTQTHALLVGSPAIDAGSSDCPPPRTDQRGFIRPIDGDANGSAICDIGAFEFGSFFTPAPTPGPSALGNADCVNGVDVQDAVVVLRVIAGVGAAPCPGNLDVNCSGGPDAGDVLAILLFDVQLPPLPVPSGCRAIGT